MPDKVRFEVYPHCPSEYHESPYLQVMPTMPIKLLSPRTGMFRVNLYSSVSGRSDYSFEFSPSEDTKIQKDFVESRHLSAKSRRCALGKQRESVESAGLSNFRV